MINLTDQQLKDINESFNWKTTTKLPDGRLLGNGKKKKFKNKDIDLFKSYFKRLNIKQCLEVGCAEGYNTVELAKICQFVIATDVRPRNIIGAMIRQWVLKLDNIEFHCLDLNTLENENPLTDIKMDIIYHTGVLYHLTNPIKHLKYIASITDNLFLATRCYDKKSDIKLLIGQMVKYENTFKQYRVNEKPFTWKRSFAGITDYSTWLHKDEIKDILHHVGFKKVILLEETRSYCPRVIFAVTK